MTTKTEYSPDIRDKAAKAMREKPTLHLPGSSARRALSPSQVRTMIADDQPSDAGLDEIVRRLEHKGWTRPTTSYRRCGR